MKDPILLVEGRESFAYIIEAIEKAQSSVYIRMFIWRDDTIGNRLAKTVIEAADRGVDVTIIKDKLGCVFEYAEETRQSFFHKKKAPKDVFNSYMIDLAYPMNGKGNGKQVSNSYIQTMVNSEHITLKTDTYYKDHSKYYIIDDQILILGGINIEDKELYADCEGRRYHDYMMAIESKEAVEAFRLRLTQAWTGFSGEDLDYIYNVTIEGQRHYGAKTGIIELLRQARSSVTIVMAYISDEDIIKELIVLSNRGVAVEIIVSEKANLQHDTNLYYMAYLMKATDNRIRVYLSPKMVHAKLIWIDHHLLTFGSTNLNKQAMEQLNELNVVLKAPDSVRDKLEMSIQNEMAMSQGIGHYKDLKYNKIKAFFERIVC